MNQLQAVLFDVDGILAETERFGHRVAINQAFGELGLDWHWSRSLYGKLLKVTGSTERVYHYIKTYRPKYRHINPDIKQLLADIIRHKNANYKQIVESGQIPLRPGVKQLLQILHESDIRLGITTTTTPQNINALLLSNIGGDVMDWFEVIVAGDQVEYKKPAPDVYLQALALLDLPPAVCLAIEDSENGVRSASAANIPVLAIQSEYTVDQDLSAARLVVDQWGGPGQPFRVLAGNAGGSEVISIDLMRKLIVNG